MRPVAGSVQGTSGDNRGSTHGGAHKRSLAGHALATPLGTKSGRPTAPPVCIENSDTQIVVMQSAEERMRRDATDPLNGAREWCIFVQRAVRSQIVVIPGIGLQNPA
jgi:hypothetical protein